MSNEQDKLKLERMLHELANEAIPERTDLWSRLRIRLKPHRPANNMLALLTLPAVIIAIALFGVLLNMLPRNSFAASTPTPTAVSEPIQNYHALLLFRQTNLTEVAITPSRGEMSYFEYQVYVWYHAPDQLRLEFYKACNLQPVTLGNAEALTVGGRAVQEGPAFDRCPQPDKILVFDSGHAILVNVSERTVQYQGVVDRSLESPFMSLLDGYLMPDSQFIPASDASDASILTRYSGASYEQVQVQDSDEVPIAGRSVRLLTRRGHIPDKPQAGILYEGDNRLWIDQTTLIPLAGERLLESGIAISNWRFLSFEPNAEVDPSLFVYLPPTAQKNQAPVTLQGVRDVWHSVARDSSLSVYFPDDLAFNQMQVALATVPQFPVYLRDQNVFRQEFLSRRDPTVVTPIFTLWQGEDTRKVLGVAGFPLEQESTLRSIDLGNRAGGVQGIDARTLRLGAVQWLSFKVGATAVVIKANDDFTLQDVTSFAESIIFSGRPANADMPVGVTVTPTPIPSTLATDVPSIIPADKVAVAICHSGLKTRSVLQYGDDLKLTVTYLIVDIPTPTGSATSASNVAREASVTFDAILIHTSGELPPLTGGIAPTATPIPLAFVATQLAAVMTALPGIGDTVQRTTSITSCSNGTVITVAVDPQDAKVLVWALNVGLPITVEKVE